MRRVSHSPTGIPSRPAAERAISRASGGMPVTFQGSVCFISRSATPNRLEKVKITRCCVKDRYQPNHSKLGTSQPSKSQNRVNERLAERRLVMAHAGFVQL